MATKRHNKKFWPHRKNFFEQKKKFFFFFFLNFFFFFFLVFLFFLIWPIHQIRPKHDSVGGFEYEIFDFEHQKIKNRHFSAQNHPNPP